MKIVRKKDKIKELDEVRLKKNLPEYKLKKGQKGIVAMIYSNKEIELALKEKNTSKLVQLPINLVE